VHDIDPRNLEREIVTGMERNDRVFFTGNAEDEQGG
jgi:hypothetical protein